MDHSPAIVEWTQALDAFEADLDAAAATLQLITSPQQETPAAEADPDGTAAMVAAVAELEERYATWTAPTLVTALPAELVPRAEALLERSLAQQTQVERLRDAVAAQRSATTQLRKTIPSSADRPAVYVDTSA